MASAVWSRVPPRGLTTPAPACLHYGESGLGRHSAARQYMTTTAARRPEIGTRQALHPMPAGHQHQLTGGRPTSTFRDLQAGSSTVREVASFTGVCSSLTVPC